MKKLFFYILITVVTTNAFADEKLNKVLDELKQIKKRHKSFRKRQYIAKASKEKDHLERQDHLKVL